MSSLPVMTVVQRFTAVGALALALSAGLGVAVVLPQWNSLVTLQDEMRGLAPASDVLRVVQLTQEHRGMSAALLSGNADLAPKREAKQSEADAALAKALASTALWTDPALAKVRDNLKATWQGLAQAVASGSLKPADSFNRHTALVQEQLNLLAEVTSASNIALDPEPETYFLTQAALTELPQATEALGELRARGAAAMKQDSLTAGDRALFGQMLGFAQQRFTRVQEEVARAKAARAPAMAPVLAELQQAEAALAETSQLVRAQLIDAEKPTGTAAAYLSTLTTSIDRLYALAGVAFKVTHGLFEERMAAARRTMAMTTGAMLLLMAGIVATVLQARRRISRDAALAMATAAHIAQGDFTHPVRSEHADEFGALVNALEQSRQRMAAAVGAVRDGVHSVALASQQIAQGNGELASRTESQASSLQETAASMEQITHTVTQASASAQQAKSLADQASAAAERGGEVVGEVVTTMQDIAASSRRIAEIIGVIDGIAFQTNILALNAAVEAARAGEQGRGFAVVASEVRSLAQRSADAAREIKDMISSSVAKVESGTRLVDGAGSSMADIVDQVRRVTELINQISQHSVEQSASLTQVNAAVSQMEQVTQRNAAHVEESAASAEEMRNQAHSLSQSMDSFKLH